MVGEWVCYNDEHDTDHDALVLEEHGGDVVDIVVVNAEGFVERKLNVPHYKLMLETKDETSEYKNRKGKVVKLVQSISRRKSGAYWRT